MSRMKSVMFPILLFFSLVVFNSCKEDTVEPIYYGNINGTVLDAENNLPIQAVSITTNPPTNSIITDENGIFKLSMLTTGTYTISASKNGFLKTSINVSVNNNETTEATILLVNDSGSMSPPLPPSNPSPSNGAEDQSTNILLTWTRDIDYENDTLLYDVFIYKSDQINPSKIAENIKDTSIVVENLNYSSIYFWQVVVKDGVNPEVNGELWTFKTKPLPNNPYVYSSDSTGNFEIYSGDGTSKNLVRLSNNSYRDWNPRINPLRGVIAFTSDRTSSYQIWKMNSDGTELFQITQVPVAGNHNAGIGFSWSPDGSALIYPNYDKLYNINSDGSGLTQISTAPEGRHFREANWSSNGDKIVVLTIGNNFYNSEIYTLNSNGTEMTMVVDDKKGAMTSPSFSVDGKYIMYSYDVSEYEDATSRQLDARIHLYSLDSLTSKDISTSKIDGTNDLNPRFSSDGSKIIFENVNNSSGKSSVWIMDYDGDNRKKVFNDGRMPDYK